MSENILMPKAAKILDILPQTATEWTFRLKNSCEVHSGQFMQLSIPKVGEAPLSISGIQAGSIDFTIRRVGHVTDALFSLHPGDSIFVRGPYGNGWPRAEFQGKHVVIVAGGTGCACVRSRIEDLYQTQDLMTGVHLVMGFKNKDSILFPEDLERWANSEKFHTIYALDTEEMPGWHKGLVTEFLKCIPFADFGAACTAAVIGPPVMMKFAGQGLIQQGVTEEQIWMSFERKMSCAVGKYGHCRFDETYVCLDGPVFNYTKAKEMVD